MTTHASERWADRAWLAIGFVTTLASWLAVVGFCRLAMITTSRPWQFVLGGITVITIAYAREMTSLLRRYWRSCNDHPRER